MTAPDGYRQLPRGVRCRCLNLWRESEGDYWCCKPRDGAAPFKIGDSVRRRFGTLGANGAEAVVVDVEDKSGFGMVSVRYLDGRSERFHWDTYEALPGPVGGPAS